jgi:hypothetical protein
MFMLMLSPEKEIAVLRIRSQHYRYMAAALHR